MPETAFQLRVKADHTATPDGNGNLPPTGQVRIGHSPDHDGSFPHEHQFGMATLHKGHAQGWLDIQDREDVVLQLDQPTGAPAVWPVVRAKRLEMHTIDGDVTFDVVRQPGLYRDGKQLPDVGMVIDPDIEVFLGMDVKLAKDGDKREWEGKA